MAAEPVVALSPVQHNFETRESNRDEQDAYVIDSKLSAAPGFAPFLAEFNRVVNHPARQQK